MSVQRVPDKRDIFESYIAQLSAMTGPKEKLEKLDELTFAELTLSSFKIMEQIGRDPGLIELCISPESLLGSLQAAHILEILSAVDRCQKLSQRALADIEKNYLWTVCPQIDTYINSKIYQVLERIFRAKNFANIFDPNNPFHPIYLEMNKLQDDNHGVRCKCYTHIQTKFHFNTQKPFDGARKTG